MKSALFDLNPCRCPLCGQPNACAMASPDAAPPGPCWCTRVDFSPSLLQQVPEIARNKACICAACVRLSDGQTQDLSQGEGA